MIKNTTLFFLLFFVSQINYAQISFNQDETNISGLEVSSGAPMSISDMNGDGLDDIVSLDNTRRLFISFQNQDRTFDVVEFGNVGSSNWGMTTADIDNDGRYEMLTGGAYDNVHLVKYTDEGNLDVKFLDGPSIFVQAVSFFDINNDGFLDAIACHDDGPNGVYINDGAGELSYMDDDTPFRKFEGQESNSGNYGNVWTDVNGDGHMDYYIAKCRQGVTNVTDERRINQLWLNNGDGTFTESAEEFGLNIGLQSWTAEFQDIDNDGDMDCFITNHDGPAQLFENIDNTSFVDITSNSGIDIRGLPIQGTMKDFDNDGFVDLFVSGTGGNFYLNNGDKTFTQLSDSDLNFDGGENSFAAGDLNHDGFLDLMIGYGNGFNGPSSKDDKLWINNTNDNHWLGVELEGVMSNRGGVGSRIELYGEWGMMVREVRAGESYGISHSLNQHFGMGTSTIADSIKVYWPSGTVDLYFDLAADQFVRLKEGSCIAPPSNIIADGPTTFCTGGSVNISAAAGYQYLWSNGATTQAIDVTTSGLYSLEISDGSSCQSTSITIEVTVDPEESFEIIPSGIVNICEGESIIVTNSLGQTVDWSTGEFSSDLEVGIAGTYSAVSDGTCEEINSNSLEVIVVPIPADPSNFDLEYTDFGQVKLTADGNGISWYEDAQGTDFIGSGNEIVIEDVFSNLTVYAQSSSENAGGLFSGGEEKHTGASDYNSEGFNGGMIFTVQEDVILRNVTMDTDTEGLRTIELRDQKSGDILDSQTMMFPVGTTTLSLNFSIAPGSTYILGTSSQQNFSTLGYESPRFKRSAVDFGSILSYPYDIGGLANIVGSNFGEGFYYYFYNWELSKDVDGCTSEIVPFEILPSSVSSIDENNAISLAPNPSDGIFNLSYIGIESFNVQVLSVDGRVLMAAKDQSLSLPVDLSNYPTGVYILKMEVGMDTYFAKMVKQ